MAINTTFRKVTLKPFMIDPITGECFCSQCEGLDPYGVIQADLDEMTVVSYAIEHGLAEEYSYDELATMYVPLIQEHSPTLTHEAVAFENQMQRVLGYDPRATAEIPTVKLQDIEAIEIELEALPACEWNRQWQTHYARYSNSDLF